VRPLLRFLPASVIKRFSRHRKSTHAVALLLMATFAGAGLNFGVQVLMARTLGVQQFGAFASAFAIVTLLAPLAGFGLGGYWLKAYGREGWDAQRWLPGSFRFLSISTAGVIAALMAWAWIGPHDFLTTAILAILVAHVIGQAAVMLTSAKYQLEGRQAALSVWQFLPHFLRFLGVGLLIVLLGADTFSAVHASIAFAVAALALVVLASFEMRRMITGRLALEGHLARSSVSDKASRPGIGQVISGAWPFGLAGIFYLIYFQSDIILIRYMVDETAAGVYNVAFVVMAAVYLFPSVFYQKFLLPKLHRWAHHDTDRLHRTYRVGNLAMLVMGVGGMVALWVGVPPLLPWLFGNEYREAISLLMILAVAAPFRFLASSAGSVLATRDYMRTKVKLMGLVALVNVVLNILFIPTHGASGAAVATVLSDALLCVLYILKSRRVMAEVQYQFKPVK